MLFLMCLLCRRLLMGLLGRSSLVLLIRLPLPVSNLLSVRRCLFAWWLCCLFNLTF